MSAISLREIIAAAIRSAGRANSYNKALFILGDIKRDGYVILSPDELRGIRDEAKAEGLEEAADYCWLKRDLLADAEKKQVAAGLTGRDYYGRRLEAELLSRAIRALKGSAP